MAAEVWFWIEEPFRPDDLESYRYLRERTNVHISGGEEVGTMFEFDDLLRNGSTLQYIASLPEAWYLEFCEQDTEPRQKLTTPIFTIDNEGYLEIPQRPGLGIDIDWDVFEYYRVK